MQFSSTCMHHYAHVILVIFFIFIVVPFLFPNLFPFINPIYHIPLSHSGYKIAPHMQRNFELEILFSLSSVPIHLFGNRARIHSHFTCHLISLIQHQPCRHQAPATFSPHRDTPLMGSLRSLHMTKHPALLNQLWPTKHRHRATSKIFAEFIVCCCVPHRVQSSRLLFVFRFPFPVSADSKCFL